MNFLFFLMLFFRILAISKLEMLKGPKIKLVNLTPQGYLELNVGPAFRTWNMENGKIQQTNDSIKFCPFTEGWFDSRLRP